MNEDEFYNLNDKQKNIIYEDERKSKFIISKFLIQTIFLIALILNLKITNIIVAIIYITCIIFLIKKFCLKNHNKHRLIDNYHGLLDILFIETIFIVFCSFNSVTTKIIGSIFYVLNCIYTCKYFITRENRLKKELEENKNVKVGIARLYKE